MTLKLQAVFDGTVFRPTEPVQLQPGIRCELTIESQPAQQVGHEADDEVYVLSAIAALATDMGIPDLADRHHEYAHRTLKQE